MCNLLHTCTFVIRMQIFPSDWGTKHKLHTRAVKKLIFRFARLRKAFQTYPASLKICFAAHFGIALGPSSASPKIAFRTTLASSKTAFRTKFSDPRFLRKLLVGHLWKHGFGPAWPLRKRLFRPRFWTPGFSENCLSETFGLSENGFSDKFSAPISPKNCFSDTFGNMFSDQLGLSENGFSDHIFGPAWFLRKWVFGHVSKHGSDQLGFSETNGFSEVNFQTPRLSENAFSEHIGGQQIDFRTPKCFRRTLAIS